MTQNELEGYFRYLALQAGFPDANLDAHVTRCCQMGLADFWGASSWSFATRPYELTISSEAEDHDLPDDFLGFRTVREKESLEGRDLRYVEKEEFDNVVPKTSAYASSPPQVFTVFYDNEDHRWKFRAMPIPETGTVIYIDMYSTSPSGPDTVPDTFIGGLTAGIEKYMYPLGSAERIHAQRRFGDEIIRLERLDSPFKGRLFRMRDVTDQQIYVERPWL